MTETHQVKDLEIAEDLNYQRYAWMVQRIGWAGITLVAIAGILGFLGPGLLSGRTVGEVGDRLWLEYERFEHFQAPAQLRVHLQPVPSKVDEILIRLDRNYVDHIQLEQVTPPPKDVIVEADHFIYIFQAISNQPTAITFYFQPQQIGPLSGAVGLEAEQMLHFQQFVYP